MSRQLGYSRFGLFHGASIDDYANDWYCLILMEIDDIRYVNHYLWSRHFWLSEKNHKKNRSQREKTLRKKRWENSVAKKLLYHNFWLFLFYLETKFEYLMNCSTMKLLLGIAQCWCWKPSRDFHLHFMNFWIIWKCIKIIFSLSAFLWLTLFFHFHSVYMETMLRRIEEAGIVNKCERDP